MAISVLVVDFAFPLTWNDKKAGNRLVSQRNIRLFSYNYIQCRQDDKKQNKNLLQNTQTAKYCIAICVRVANCNCNHNIATSFFIHFRSFSVLILAINIQNLNHTFHFVYTFKYWIVSAACLSSLSLRFISIHNFFCSYYLIPPKIVSISIKKICYFYI